MSASSGGPPVLVVGVDGSDTARQAAERAAELAAQLGARLHVVSAVRHPKTATVEGPGGDTWVLDDAERVRARLDDMVATWPDIETSTATLAGKPADVLVDEAERLSALAIVVGNKRMQGISRVLGAVAGEVAQKAHCDVYIVNTRG